MSIAEQRIQSLLKNIAPTEDAEQIIFYLQGKTNISEFIIAEELDLEIHRTRHILYKLLDVNLVSFKRKKDKIKGWYICYWDFNEDAIPHLEEKYRVETLNKLRNRLKNEESGFFYMCRSAHVRQNFDVAFENDFKCPECGEIMNQLDNTRTISFLQSRISELEEQQAKYEEFKKKRQEEASKQYEKE